MITDTQNRRQPSSNTTSTTGCPWLLPRLDGANETMGRASRRGGRGDPVHISVAYRARSRQLVPSRRERPVFPIDTSFKANQSIGTLWNRVWEGASPHQTGAFVLVPFPIGAHILHSALSRMRGLEPRPNPHRQPMQRIPGESYPRIWAGLEATDQAGPQGL